MELNTCFGTAIEHPMLLEVDIQPHKICPINIAANDVLWAAADVSFNITSTMGMGFVWPDADLAELCSPLPTGCAACSDPVHCIDI